MKPSKCTRKHSHAKLNGEIYTMFEFNLKPGLLIFYFKNFLKLSIKIYYLYGKFLFLVACFGYSVFYRSAGGTEHEYKAELKNPSARFRSDYRIVVPPKKNIYIYQTVLIPYARSSETCKKEFL